MDFDVGQRVVCVDAKPRDDRDATLIMFLREGAIYTVRSLETHPSPSAAGFPTMRVEEIKCPVMDTSHGLWEIGFAPDRFRPVTPTSIDVFEEMLVRASNPWETVSDAKTKGA